jgi:hypothetical protein
LEADNARIEQIVNFATALFSLLAAGKAMQSNEMKR